MQGASDSLSGHTHSLDASTRENPPESPRTGPHRGYRSKYGSISMPNRPTGPNTCHNNNENETCAVAHNLVNLV